MCASSWSLSKVILRCAVNRTYEQKIKFAIRHSATSYKFIFSNSAVATSNIVFSKRLYLSHFHLKRRFDFNLEKKLCHQNSVFGSTFPLIPPIPAPPTQKSKF